MNREILQRIIMLLTCSAALFAPAGCATKAPAGAAGNTYSVVEVPDSDALLVKDSKGTEYILYIADIDAPEITQEFGPAARDYLRRLTEYSSIEVPAQTVIGEKEIEGEVLAGRTDLGEALVGKGLAWVKPDVKDENLMSIMREARRTRTGVWSQKNAIPPWKFRESRTGEDFRLSVLRGRVAMSSTGRPLENHETRACASAPAIVGGAYDIYRACLTSETPRSCFDESARYNQVVDRYMHCF